MTAGIRRPPNEPGRHEADPRAVPFLSTASATHRDRIAASIVVAISLLGLAVVVPLRDMPWSRLTAFVPADDTGLALINMITAMLLIGQFFQLRTPALLLLTCGYLFSCFAVIAHLLSSAEALRASHPDLANLQTTAWLTILWHGIFPTFVLAYALAVEAKTDLPALSRMPGLWLTATVALAAGITWLSVTAATGGVFHLPPLVSEDDSGMVAARLAAWAAGAIGLICLVGLILQTRLRRVLDLWLGVVLLASILDIVIGGALTSAPFDFGGYAARIFGLLAASVVLGALLLEAGQLYGRLSRAIAEIHAQSVELDRSEAALRQAQKMDVVGQITGGVAHDFNNLLTVVIGSLDLIRRHPDDAGRTVRRVNMALEAANRAAQLTRQLLAFSRHQPLKPEIVAPNRLIREFKGLLQQAVGEAVEIRLELASKTAPVRLDPAQFQAAILNLAVNARDAMNGAGTLRITTSVVSLDRVYAELNPEAAPGNYVLIAVADAGCGMDEEAVARAFEPFFTTKEVGKGSGLGLSQVYGFARSADGHVRLRSKPGQGTVVELYLPRADAAFPGPVPKEADTEILPSAGGETILLVEDEAGVRDTTAESVAELGYVVRAAADASSALDLLRSGAKVDAVFSDVVMSGGMNGAELAITIRQLRPRLPILLTSGYAAGVLDRAGDLPSDVEILPKPYSHEILAGKLRSLLDASAKAAFG